MQRSGASQQVCSCSSQPSTSPRCTVVTGSLARRSLSAQQQFINRNGLHVSTSLAGAPGPCPHSLALGVGGSIVQSQEHSFASTPGSLTRCRAYQTELVSSHSEPDAEAPGHSQGPASSPGHEHANAALIQLADAFQLPVHRVRPAVVKQPALLTLPPQKLVERLEAYSQATGLPNWMLLYIVARKPSMLQLSPAELHARCQALADALGSEMEQAVALIASQPAFLDMPPGAIQDISIRLATSMSMHRDGALALMARLQPPALRTMLDRPPGWLRDKIVSIRRLLEEAFGNQAQSADAPDPRLLVIKCPALLSLPTKTLAESLYALMQLRPTKGMHSGLRSSSVLMAIRSCPNVLTLPAATLRSCCVILTDGFRIDMPAVVGMLILQPRLFLLDPQVLIARFHAMTSQLQFPRTQVLDMVVRQPQLLLLQTDMLGENFTSLQTSMGIPYAVARNMVQRHPNILNTKAVSIPQRISAFAEMFSIPYTKVILLFLEEPTLLTFSLRRYQRIHEVLTQVLLVPQAELKDIIKRCHQLLTEDTTQLAGKVGDLALLVGVREDVAASMARRAPQLLLQEYRCWQTNLDTITGLLGLSRPTVVATLIHSPSLLAQEPSDLHRKASAIADICSTHPAWHLELGKLTPKQVPMVLNPSTVPFEQLQYLAHKGLQDQVPFMHESVWNQAGFANEHPLFVGWQHAQKLQQRRSRSREGARAAVMHAAKQQRQHFQWQVDQRQQQREQQQQQQQGMFRSGGMSQGLQQGDGLQGKQQTGARGSFYGSSSSTSSNSGSARLPAGSRAWVSGGSNRAPAVPAAAAAAATNPTTSSSTSLSSSSDEDAGSMQAGTPPPTRVRLAPTPASSQGSGSSSSRSITTGTAGVSDAINHDWDLISGMDTYADDDDEDDAARMQAAMLLPPQSNTKSTSQEARAAAQRHPSTSSPSQGQGVPNQQQSAAQRHAASDAPASASSAAQGSGQVVSQQGRSQHPSRSPVSFEAGAPGAQMRARGRVSDYGDPLEDADVFGSRSSMSSMGSMSSMSSMGSISSMSSMSEEDHLDDDGWQGDGVAATAPGASISGGAGSAPAVAAARVEQERSPAESEQLTVMNGEEGREHESRSKERRDLPGPRGPGGKHHASLEIAAAAYGSSGISDGCAGSGGGAAAAALGAEVGRDSQLQDVHGFLEKGRDNAW